MTVACTGDSIDLAALIPQLQNPTLYKSDWTCRQEEGSWEEKQLEG
jgi:hypothetical protein